MTAVVLEQWYNRWDGRLAAMLRIQGGSGGVGAVLQEAGTCCRPPCWGGVGNKDSLLSALKPEEPSPSTKGCPVPSHSTEVSDEPDLGDVQGIVC
ncbi:hypothetical protein ROHU_009888 [Labeo rohita]|uniref:Uncharacterized protein n=1 Tax=Labeo rohita TaxID=84645 RepID=A0A498LWZ4_LABRO|nr:hypothetical protein ROHU_009888 [Labeo rohita]